MSNEFSRTIIMPQNPTTSLTFQEVANLAQLNYEIYAQATDPLTSATPENARIPIW